MQIKEITFHLESLAPRALQEGYDNSGLLIGNPEAEVNKILVSLDVTEAVIEEAVSKGCNMIISHHPIVFEGLKSLTGKNYVERTVIAAIKSNIALYAIHTNLDNVHIGVNKKIGEKLGVINMQILAPKSGILKKLVVFVPVKDRDTLLEAMFAAGAGKVGEYDECGFQIQGQGSFRGTENSNPSIGKPKIREYVEEVRVEVLVPDFSVGTVLKAMHENHPYEEVAHDIYTLENIHQNIGSGMYGQLPEPMYALDFLQMVKDKFGGVMRYTSAVKDQVSKIAWCGGSGSFLLPYAKGVNADLFLTSDFKYHQFFDAENEIIVADIGHYENEQFTKQLIAEFLIEKFPSFAVLLAETNTNPINYL